MIPGQPPPNPSLLVFDSDVLLQLLVCGRLSLLRFLKTTYGVQPCIAEAVNGEFFRIIESDPRFCARREQGNKALRNGSLVVLSRPVLGGIFGNVAPALLAQAEDDGRKLYDEKGLGRGEAYSIAAALCFGCPVFTNDGSALQRLARASEALPGYCLRFWDLLVFAHQAEHLEVGDCDQARQSLRAARERTLPCFTNKNYVDGLREFFPRLVDSSRPKLQCGKPQGRLDNELRLIPLAIKDSSAMAGYAH